MAASTSTATAKPVATAAAKPKKQSHLLSDIVVNGALIILVIMWTIPTVGLVVSSFRTRFDIQTSGWWTIFPPTFCPASIAPWPRPAR